MTASVAISAWLLFVLIALAAWALWDHVLGPAWRWFMARTANQVIDELSTRLRIGIRTWQRTRRQALMDRLITDTKVRAAAEQGGRRRRVRGAEGKRIVRGAERQ